MNALDVLGIALGSGPGAAHFAQPLRGGFALTGHFGDPDGDTISTALQATGNAVVRAPHNCMVRRVPELAAQDATTTEAKATLTELLAGLRGPTGQRLGLGELQEGDLLLTVWPAAYRALETVFASLELPLPESAGGDLPGFPVPRTWWIRGLTAASLQAAMVAEVARQFTGFPPPDIDAFLAGTGELYVPADTELGSAGGDLRLRCWDGGGLPVCPNAVLGTFTELAQDVGALFAKPDSNVAGTWAGPTRIVLAFSDAEGVPYTPWEDPPAPGAGVPAPPPTTPLRQVVFDAVGADTEIPATGVLRIEEADPRHAQLQVGITDMVFDGEHVLAGAFPHGRLSAQPSVSLQAHSFLRVRVMDLARWFPHHPNPKNDFQRYSLGNALQPLADGRPVYRELYRSTRATHRVETYAGLEHMPEGAPLGAQPAGQPFQALLINAWYSPETPLLGRRAMNPSPRTQPGAMEEEGDPVVVGLVPREASDLLARFSWVAKASFPNNAPNPGAGGGGPGNPASIGADWYWLTAPGALPPGAWLRLQQVDTSDKHVAPDPADPAAVATVDAFGNLSLSSTPSAFVGPGGQVCLSLRYDPDHALPGPGGNPALRGELLAMTWEPEEDDPEPESLEWAGKGAPQARGYGLVELELPLADPLQAPAFAHPSVSLVEGAHLERTAAAGGVRVVLPPGMITGPCTVVVVTPRSGAVAWKQLLVVPAVDAEVHVAVDGFAYDETLLVGFRDNAAATGEAFPADTDPAAVPPDLTVLTHLFPLSFPDEARLAGQVPAHPKESLGLLREAVDAGVDVRLMAWRDDTKSIKDQLGRSLGGVLGLNATWDGKRGQAILDGITRETGSHHQKPAFIFGPEGPVGFVGGVDQAGGRYAPRGHAAVDPDRPGGLWHDIHCKVVGPAALDVYRNFRDRWNAWLAHPEIAVADLGLEPADPGLQPLPDLPQAYLDTVQDDGPHVVQINRTIAKGIEQYEAFLEPGLGDLSIKASYERAFQQARRFLYFEEQYWWNLEYAQQLNQRLQDGSLDFVMVLLPRFLSEMKFIDLLLYAVRREALSMLLYGTKEQPAAGQEHLAPGNVAAKVALFHIRNDGHEPVYVHCKCVIADDTWMSIGSSNMNRRSFSYDSELAAAMVDTRMRRAGHRTVRAFRVDLLAEHLRLEPWETPLVEDPMDAFRLVKAVLDGTSSRETNITSVDLRETHYGIQPDSMDGDFHEALRIAFDPDGDELKVASRLLTLAALLHQAMDDPADPNFSGMGSLRVSIEFPAATDPATVAGLEATFEVVEDTPGADLVQLGPYPATEPALLGLIATGVSYTVSVRVADPANPEVALWEGATGPFATPGFANAQVVVVGPA